MEIHGRDQEDLSVIYISLGQSTSGVMNSHWDWSDYSRMAREPLPFTDLDIQVIHKGLGARADRTSCERLSEVAWPGTRFLLSSNGDLPRRPHLRRGHWC